MPSQGLTFVSVCPKSCSAGASNAEHGRGRRGRDRQLQQRVFKCVLGREGASNKAAETTFSFPLFPFWRTILLEFKRRNGAGKLLILGGEE